MALLSKTVNLNGRLSLSPVQSSHVIPPSKTLCWLIHTYRIKAKLLSKQISFSNLSQDTFPDSYPASLPHSQWFTHSILPFSELSIFTHVTA